MSKDVHSFQVILMKPATHDPRVPVKSKCTWLFPRGLDQGSKSYAPFWLSNIDIHVLPFFFCDKAWMEVYYSTRDNNCSINLWIFFEYMCYGLKFNSMITLRILTVMLCTIIYRCWVLWLCIWCNKCINKYLRLLFEYNFIFLEKCNGNCNAICVWENCPKKFTNMIS